MSRPCFLTTLCVVLCLSACPSQGGLVPEDCLPSCNYTQEWLKKTEYSIRDLAISRHTEKVYVVCFSDTLLVLTGGGNVTEKSVWISTIRTVAVDNTEPKVYIGSDLGLQIYDELTGSITEASLTQYRVSKLFVPKNTKDLYVVTSRLYNGGRVYRYQNEMLTEQSKLSKIQDGSSFVVDFDGNFFYTAKGDILDVTKVLLKGHDNPVTINGGPFTALAVDNEGKVFGTTYHSMLCHLKTDGTSQSVAKLFFSPQSMSFDENNNAMFGSFRWTARNDVVLLKFDGEYPSNPTAGAANDTSITSNEFYNVINT